MGHLDNLDTLRPLAEFLGVLNRRFKADRSNAMTLRGQPRDAFEEDQVGPLVGGVGAVGTKSRVTAWCAIQRKAVNAHNSGASPQTSRSRIASKTRGNEVDVK